MTDRNLTDKHGLPKGEEIHFCGRCRPQAQIEARRLKAKVAS
jgi:hypothetical protein